MLVNGSTGGFGTFTTLQADLGGILLPMGVRLPPLAPGAAWTLCLCADGGLYTVPGTVACDDPAAAAADPGRCA